MNHKKFITILMYSMAEQGLPGPGHGARIVDRESGLIYYALWNQIRDAGNFSGMIAGHDEQIAFKVRDGQIELRN